MKHILLLGALLGVLGGPYATAEAAKPNLVILLVDDLGYGDPQCFNPQSKIATPNIDRLAREGLRFTDAHAPGPLCHPSRYGLMTGRYPFRTDISRWPTQPLIEKGQVTIASLLRDQGYRTAMVGKWHLGFRENGYDQRLPGGPLDCGFDSFFGLRASTDIPPYFYLRGDRSVAPPTGHIAAHHSEGWSPTQGAFWREGGIAPGLSLADVLPRLTDEACALINTHAGNPPRARRPLMLYLAYTAPHTPWLPSAEFAGKSGAGMYGDFVMMVDAQIGRVLAALDKADMTADTLLIFMSDNGPMWWPTDVTRFGHDAAGGLRGMKSDAWEGGHRMPFIARWPGRVKAGTVTDQTICFTDLLATLAEICGTKLPPGAGPDSFSFLPVLEGRQPNGQPVRGPIVMQAGSSSAMVIRSGDWKLINQLGSGGFSKPKTVKPEPGGPAGQLYNLRNDRAETNNLYLKHPEIVARLEAEMQRIVKAETEPPPTRVVEVAVKPGGNWVAHSTRILADLPGAAAIQPDVGSSLYGGLTSRQEKATGFFHTVKKDGRWWLVDPEGFLFLHKGVTSVSMLHTTGAQAAWKEKFGSETNWAEQTTALLRAHGFNGLGAWTDTEPMRSASPPLAYTRIWNFMSSYGKKRGGTFQKPGQTGYPGDCIFVFDPGFETFCEDHARQLAADKDDPWLLGHFSDNEMPLRPGALTNYLALPATDPGYQAALTWLRTRRGANATARDIQPPDLSAFLEYMVDRYFRIVSRAIKRHDPNHLYLGARFHGSDLRFPEIFRAAGPHLDVVSVNYYRAWTPDRERLAMWERESGKPVLITEWYAKGADSGLANTSGAGWLVKTQRDRGLFYENFTLGLLQSKVCVGWHWFKYIDNDPSDTRADPSNQDSNKGILSNRYDPYPPLLDSMKRINERTYGLVDYFDKL